MNNDEKQFFVELEKISRKYKIAIGGCGCCDSPHLQTLDEPELVEEAGYVDGHIQWVCPEDFEWDAEDYMYKDRIVSKENLDG